MTAAEIRRRFLILRALRWLPTGLTIPVMVLLLLGRGLTVGEIGVVTAAQGIVVMLLELPTGGLADSLGRRLVLLGAAGFDLASLSLLIIADTVPLLVAVFALQGVYRALDSGPLDAWYVDAAQAVEPDADIEGALGASGAVLGVALAVGTVASSGLVVLEPFPSINPLVAPLLVALVFRALELVTISTLMVEPARPRPRRLLGGLPMVVGDSLRTIRGSHVLLALIAIELLWGAGMVAFETFTPVRLESVLGDPDHAAALLGPTNAIAWLASAGGAAAAPWLTRRAGAPLAGAAMRIAQGVTVAGIALFAGPAGVVLAYVATMAIHGAANPIHQTLLHRAVADPHHRATVLSANSLTGHLGWAIGAIGLGFLADATTVTIGIQTGAVLLAIAAPLYLQRTAIPASRVDHDRAHELQGRCYPTQRRVRNADHKQRTQQNGTRLSPSPPRPCRSRTVDRTGPSRRPASPAKRAPERAAHWADRASSMCRLMALSMEPSCRPDDYVA